jgi:hypothetical protein
VGYGKCECECDELREIDVRATGKVMMNLNVVSSHYRKQGIATLPLQYLRRVDHTVFWLVSLGFLCSSLPRSLSIPQNFCLFAFDSATTQHPHISKKVTTQPLSGTAASAYVMNEGPKEGQGLGTNLCRHRGQHCPSQLCTSTEAPLNRSSP